jgi:hypothetical protein
MAYRSLRPTRQRRWARTGDVARMVARHGAPSIEDHGRVYEHEQIRRRHPVDPSDLELGSLSKLPAALRTLPVD